MILNGWVYLSGLVLLALAWRVAHFFDHLRDLADFVPIAHDPAGKNRWPKVSLIIPACNEALTIRPAVESLLKLDYPELEIVLVDDRSNDGTTDILRELAALDTRIRLIEIKILPDGWLGKVHALHCGVKASSGEWLLFTDADVHHGPQSLKKAITACTEKTLDFLCVAPTILSKSLGLKMFIAQFFQNAAFSINLKRVNDPYSSDCLGAGAFNLVRRQIYENSKGLEWLRLEVVDDIGLAQTMKESGAKVGVLGGKGEVEIEWYPDLNAFIKGVEKNSFSVFQYSFGALATYIVSAWILVAGLVIVPWFSDGAAPKFFIFVCLVVYMTVTGMRLSRVLYTSPWIVIWFPLTTALLPLFVLRAALITHKQNGIYWRGTFYGLTQLRANQRIKPFEILLGARKP